MLASSLWYRDRVSFEERAGVFVVRYGNAEALSPGAQGELDKALRTASRVAPVGVVFVVSPSVQWVGHEIPNYWLNVAADAAVRLAAIAVVTPNPAVSVATRSFSTANILRNTSVSVKPFSDETSALEWIHAEVSAAKRRLLQNRSP